MTRRASSVVGRARRSAARSFQPAARAQFQLRFRAPAGTKFESTERLADDVLDEITQAAGPDNVEITPRLRRRAALVVPDQHDLSLDRRLARGRAAGGAQARRASCSSASFEETLRGALPRASFPMRSFSFEPGDIVSRIMNFGAPTPVEVAVAGPGLRRESGVRRQGARRAGARFRALRDLQIEQTLDYPAIQVERRPRAGRTAGRDASIRSAGRSPRRRRRAASSRRTTGPIRAPASPSRCRCRFRSRG